MADFEHPPAIPIISESLSPERSFAQTAHSLISKYGVNRVRMSLGQEAAYRTTDYVELTLDEEKGLPENTELALRLFTSTVFACKGPDNFVSSSRYLVMELQYGRIEPEVGEKEILGKDYEWQPYVVVIVDAEQTDVDVKLPNDPYVLDAKTGKPLSGEDLTQAGFFLGQLQAELQADDLGKVLYRMWHNDKISYHNAGMKIRDFDPDDFVVGESCGECGHASPCEHKKSSLN